MSHWDTNEKLRAHAIGQTISRNWDSVDKTQKKHMFWAYIGWEARVLLVNAGAACAVCGG
jgi:hypothetical protein